ncbi:hypothetical protein BFP76_00300 [Amylibacter kogurei]|uniref:HTH lysR-type domain-containing protein n=2 Tax=Paramylibacter kogurei TaxID=1889778 RepID=A0A2G5K9B7_9RHOB|nr:hypothetical protein BFP76_00300 [Amylibacter kogurei]
MYMLRIKALKLKPIQLRLVVALAETGKLQSAADSLGIAQPAASRALAEIEKLAGTPLFARHPKGMRITLEGKIIANKAHAILREAYELEDSLTNIKQGKAGKIRIGAVTGPAVKFVVPAIREIKKQSVNLEITVAIAPSRQLLHELVSGRLDLIMARLLPEFDSREFEVTPVGDEQVVLLVRKNHPLAAQGNLKLQDLQDQEWIVQEKDNPIREAVSAAFHMEGISEPTNIIGSSSFLFAMGYLSETDAIVAVTQEVAQLLIDEPIKANFSKLKLNQPIGMTPYFLVRFKSHSVSPATQLLTDFIVAQSTL